jgi:hypothetical protein
MFKHPEPDIKATQVPPDFSGTNRGLETLPELCGGAIHTFR